jgi:hypothetical protein
VGSVSFPVSDELKIARCGRALSNALSVLTTRGSPPTRVGIKSKASATNVSDPAVRPTQGAQRHSTKSLTS